LAQNYQLFNIEFIVSILKTETNIDSKTRNRSRNILKQYYGNNENSDQSIGSVCDPFDIQSHDFNCEIFINKVFIYLFIIFIINIQFNTNKCLIIYVLSY
jgi:hypothetical protein